jgi:methionyl-tRNA synthetase
MHLDLEADAARAMTEFEQTMTGFEFHKGLIAIWTFIGRLNKCIDVSAPWELAKRPSTRKQLECVIYNLLEGLRVIAGLIYPVMPDTARAMQQHLGLDPDSDFFLLDHIGRWKTLQPGSKLPKSKSLFPRVDMKPIAASARTKTTSEKLTPSLRPLIGIDDFANVDLRVATVVKAEAIPKAKKLLKLEVDMGERRTIVAGIANFYRPEELVGRQVIVVANLKPAKLMGIESQGMLLAAVDGDQCTISSVEKKARPGARIS